MTKYSMIVKYSSLCNLWYWLLMQPNVRSGTQSISTHSKMLTKTLLQHWKVLMLTQMLWGSAGKRNKVSMIKSYTRAYRCKFAPPLLSRSDNFVVIPVLNKQRGCVWPEACLLLFKKEYLFLFRGKKLPHMAVSRRREFHGSEAFETAVSL